MPSDRAGKFTTVQIAQPERDWLARHGAKMPEQIREDLATLQALARPPQLSEGEWNLLRDILNSTHMDPGQVRRWPWLLAADVRDSAPDGLAEKWAVDLEALARRLESLHPADAWAVVDSVRRWWAEQG
jgi:hypothetical protein